MIEPLITQYPINDRNFDYNHQELTTLQLLAKIIPKLNEVIELANTVDGKIAAKEDSINITNNRKLSLTGNFTGRLNNRSVTSVLNEVDDTTNKIVFLADQFSDGHTGQIVDGGFFEDSAISKNYDGGIF